MPTPQAQGSSHIKLDALTLSRCLPVNDISKLARTSIAPETWQALYDLGFDPHTIEAHSSFGKLGDEDFSRPIVERLSVGRPAEIPVALIERDPSLAAEMAQFRIGLYVSRTHANEIYTQQQADWSSPDGDSLGAYSRGYSTSEGLWEFQMSRDGAQPALRHEMQLLPEQAWDVLDTLYNEVSSAYSASKPQRSPDPSPFRSELADLSSSEMPPRTGLLAWIPKFRR
ncbi:MAG: hypothetical protein J0M12_13165 [Deltaproteobacteria bacterium]|nr:hypothetical protein [Deltaproteobacteria bacterium]